MSNPTSGGTDNQVAQSRHFAMRSLASKRVTAPALPSTFVGRPRLRKMIGDPHNRVVTLAAPPGAGKTTAMVDAFLDSDQTSSWLTVLPNDHSLSFAELATFSLVQANSDIVAQSAELLFADEPLSDEQLIASLSNELSHVGKPVTMFLDGIDHLSVEEGQEGVSRFIEMLPENVKLVFSYRGASPVPLSTFRLAGTITEIGSGELDLAVGEGQAIAANFGITNIDAVENLLRRCEGWTAGFCLGVAAAQQAKDPDQELSDFGGSHRYLQDFFAEHVTEPASGDVNDFLMRTAGLLRLSSRLCDALLHQTNSSQMLSELTDSGSFVRTIESNPGWYRYRGMFREYLLAQVEQRFAGREAVTVTNTQAVDWLNKDGQNALALQYAIDSKEDSLVFQTATTGWHNLMSNDDITSLVHLFSQVDGGAILRSQPIAGAVAVANALSGQATAASDATDNLAEQQRRWTDSRLLVEATLAFGGVPERREKAKEAWEGPCAEESQPAAALLYGLGSLWQGDEPTGSELLDMLVEKPSRHPFVGTYALAELAHLNLARGMISQGSKQASEAMKLAERGNASDLVVGAVAKTAQAWAHAFNGRPHASRALLVHAAEQIDTVNDSLPLDAFRSRVALVDVYLELDDAQAVRQQLTRLSTMSERLKVSQLATRVSEQTTQLVQRHGDFKPVEAVTFTNREHEVLELLASDMSAREIGETLYLSVNTIKTYLRRIYRKLSATSREEAVSVASSLGLIEKPEPDDDPRDRGV